MFERLITAPAGQVLSTADALAQCRVDTNDEDALFDSYIAAAAGRVEDVTGRQLLAATWEQVRSGWPACGWIEVPRPPLRSVTSITYLDTAGVSTTWAASNYVVDAPGGPTAPRGRITLASGATWPTVLDQANAITIRFVAGYGGPGEVPETIKQAMRLMIGAWYEGRENDIVGTIVAEVPLSASRLLRPFWSRSTQRAA